MQGPQVRCELSRINIWAKVSVAFVLPALLRERYHVYPELIKPGVAEKNVSRISLSSAARRVQYTFFFIFPETPEMREDDSALDGT